MALNQSTLFKRFCRSSHSTWRSNPGTSRNHRYFRCTCVSALHDCSVRHGKGSEKEEGRKQWKAVQG